MKRRPRLSAGRFDPAFRLAESLVQRGAPPTVLGISDARRTIRVQSFGSQQGTPIPADIVAPLFSVTKPMVAAAVAQLWERGLLNLHEFVASYLPGFEANGKQAVMIRHLLTHTSGINEAASVEAMRRGCGPEELEAAVMASPLDAVPGTRQRYSSAAFVALGMIVRKVSGQPLDRYMAEEIFGPLGMTRTGYDPAVLTTGMVMEVPNLPDLGMSPTMSSFVPLAFAGAGLWSCAEDVLAFGRVFLRGGRTGRGAARILSPAACDAILSPQTPGVPSFVPGDFDGWVMGLGWYLPAPPSHKVMALEGANHSGAGGCQVFVSRRWGIACAVITARIRHRTEKLLNALFACLPEA